MKYKCNECGATRELHKSTTVLIEDKWVVKEAECTCRFKPEEYEKFKSARTMYGDKDLLNLLEQNYEKKKNNS